MVIPWIVEFLRERGLQFSEEKTKIVHIDEGFDFLGWNFRKYDGKMLIKPSKKNVKAFYSKVSEGIGSSLSVPTELLIRKLNPVLRGWAEYHKGVVAKATFSRLDHLIYWRLMKWGRRRHPRKSGKWVYDHYWPQLGSRRAMAVHLPDQNGDLRSLVLYQLADTIIVRHQKVDGKYNPFDPAWFAYAERLLTARMSQDIWDTQRLKLWLQQGGKCVLCEQFIDSTRAMDDHHIVYREYGGSHALSNRVLLHPVCLLNFVFEA
jgi:RNA-directed DNA polymerase